MQKGNFKVRKKKVLTILLAFISLFTLSYFSLQQGFLDRQLTNYRVKAAWDKKSAMVRYMLTQKQIDPNYFDLYIRVFKEEQIVELWAKNTYQSTYRLIISMPYCMNSGLSGPKRRAGDKQIPEGFYKISVFNPFSDFYLSLGINYPNASDSFFSDMRNPGGDIYIHGGCETIGCIPLTDERIEEVYLLAVLSKNGGNGEIPVHIFPCRLNTPNYKYLIDNANDNNLRRFWGNIRTGYLLFEQEGKIPEISVNNFGYYEFKEKP